MSHEAEVRFYVDADLLGLGQVLGGLRYDVTYPGDPGATIHKHVRSPCPIGRADIHDEDWIPVVASHGWLAITRDHYIGIRPSERAALLDYGAKVVNLTAADAGNTWGQLGVVLRHWTAFEHLQRLPGPFFMRASLTGIRAVTL